ncbi:tyrosine-tRNA ligase [Pneumocystis carinii B80]|uniref:Tyrosine--tRNA ligase n=1 Tax=Pneumocystis carinii (strain B80) TaxID=1408658 RepID=A0A0W4ZK69_PNEC8|nr:tyrosine-tRNA ligase [Pneumocystis carinii B80]KTW28771.1 tyrosine-tRNA ligase [Pneumocystis carinii B80]
MGVDPTGASLHIGHLVVLLPLLHFYLKGHFCYGIVGGGTSRIGDPSGKMKEREKMSLEYLSENCLKIESQLDRFFKNGTAYALKRGYDASKIGKYYIINNLTWYNQLSLFDFLKIVGHNIQLKRMLSRDSVKNRFESNRGINYNEFTYQLLQAYDFWYLNQHYNVSLQIGGSDQWGNIVSGIELINKMNSQESQTNSLIFRREPYGMIVPLLLKKNGEKIGKSSGNAIWLNPDMISPYELYQFFVQSSDEIVEKYLKFFTLLPLDVIYEIIKQHSNNPEKRYAQHKLAEEIVMLIHGQEEMEKSRATSQLLFSNQDKELEISQIFKVFSDKQDIITLSRKKVIGVAISQIIKETNVISSKSKINKLIQNGGVRSNKEKITNPSTQVTEDWLIGNKFLILKLGKKKHLIINVEN